MLFFYFIKKKKTKSALVFRYPMRDNGKDKWDTNKDNVTVSSNCWQNVQLSEQDTNFAVWDRLELTGKALMMATFPTEMTTKPI
jgi:hypothetical protein